MDDIRNMELLPYQFEPEWEEDELQQMDNEEASDDASDAGSNSEPEENMADRLNNLGWCQCEL